MTQNMTKMILAEKDIECEAIQGNSPRALSKKASCRHTLGILHEYSKSKARVWLEYGKSMARVWLKHVLTPVRLRTMCAVLLMLVCSTSAWSQTEGVYYIDNNTGHSGADNARYYIVPADDPQKSDKHDAFYSSNYSSQNGDREKPFLTVYKTNKDKVG